MNKYMIRGGRELYGEITVSGAKNAAVAIIPAALLVDDRYFMSSVKIGPKGQIVIPKEARDMFGLEPGDTLVLMADKKKGLALQTVDKLNPLRKTVFNSLPSEDGEVDDE